MHDHQGVSVAGGGTLNETEIDEGLDEEFVMTWMGLILRDLSLIHI